MREPEDALEREERRGVVHAERDRGDARDGERAGEDLRSTDERERKTERCALDA